MIKFIICEDKQRDLERAKMSINRVMVKYNLDYRIFSFDGLNKELENLINDNDDIKIYILDVELNESSGIEIGSIIRENDWDSYIIFVTSYPEFKNDVFHARLLVMDYISKYNTYELRLQETIEKIINKEQNYNSIRVRRRGEEFNVKYNDIVFLEKEIAGNKTIIYLKNKEKIEVNESLKSLEKRLTNTFFKTHQSAIINLDFFLSVNYDKSIINFKNGMNTNLLSLRRKKELKERLRNGVRK